MGEYWDVLIVGELEQDRLSSMTVELLGVASALCRGTGGETILAFLGKDPRQNIAARGYGYGADRVYVARHVMLADYIPDAFLQAMVQVTEKTKPAIVLFGQTDLAIDLAPRLAFRLHASAALDCVAVKASGEGRIEITKPVFGGKAHAVLAPGVLPSIVSLRQGSYGPPEYNPLREGAVLPLDLSLDPARVRVRFVRRIRDENLSLSAVLTNASVVVSGGRGIKGLEGVRLLRETAAILGGAVGGSRPTVDNGWLPSQLQVGLTGRRVNPPLYMAVGISGALQHMAGCMNSKTIVAINSDESAPIFRMAHVGVVGDLTEVLEGFNEEMRGTGTA